MFNTSHVKGKSHDKLSVNMIQTSPHVQVSIVGSRGAGKSTLISLLSGNETMFKTGKAATGTTTTGVDISGIIPSRKYAAVLAGKLKREHLTDDVHNDDPPTLPMFFIDSEGMGVRGEQFDFMVTSPLAIVASHYLGRIGKSSDCERSDEN